MNKYYWAVKGNASDVLRRLDIGAGIKQMIRSHVGTTEKYMSIRCKLKPHVVCTSFSQLCIPGEQ